MALALAVQPEVHWQLLRRVVTTRAGAVAQLELQVEATPVPLALALAALQVPAMSVHFHSTSSEHIQVRLGGV